MCRHYFTPQFTVALWVIGALTSLFFIIRVVLSAQGASEDDSWVGFVTILLIISGLVFSVVLFKAYRKRKALLMMNEVHFDETIHKNKSNSHTIELQLSVPEDQQSDAASESLKTLPLDKDNLLCQHEQSSDHDGL